MPTLTISAQMILDALECGGPSCDCHASARRGHGLTHCPCPDHHDGSPSLNVDERDGMVLLKCHGGCSQRDVIDALRARGLWPERRSAGDGTAPRGETRYTINNAAGDPIAVHVRRDTPHGKRLHWERPDGAMGLAGMPVVTLPLYGIDRLNGHGYTILVEGEKSREAGARLGLPTVATVTGASTIPVDEVLQTIADRQVYLWGDADRPGHEHMRRIAERLHALGCPSIKLIQWEQAPIGGDAADFVQAGGTRADVAALMTAAEPWKPDARFSITSTSLYGDGDYGESAGQVDPPIDLATVADPGPTTFIVDEMIPRGYPTNLYADSGQGKSYVALHLAACLLEGTPFLGRDVSQGAVLYLDWELDAPMQRRRWGEVCRGANLDPLPPGLHYRRMTASLTAMIADVQAWQTDLHPMLTIIDSVGKAVGTDPVDHRAIIGFYTALDQLGTVLCIDHQPKPSGEGSYAAKWEFGSAYKRHLARSSWQLERAGANGGTIGLVLRHKKSNFGPLSNDIHATLTFGATLEGETSVTLAGVDSADAVRGATFGLRGEIIEALSRESLSKEQLSQQLESYSPGSVTNALSELKKSGLVVIVGKDGRAPVYGLADASPSPPLYKDVEVMENPNTPVSSGRCRHCERKLIRWDELQSGVCDNCRAEARV